MSPLEPHADGTILPVRAQPGARRNEIRGVQDGMLKVCVTQSPERGKANKAMVALLSKSLGLKKSQFELIAGETSHQKRFLVRGITPSELAAQLKPQPPTAKATAFTGTFGTLRSIAQDIAPRPVARSPKQLTVDRGARSCCGREAFPTTPFHLPERNYPSRGTAASNA